MLSEKGNTVSPSISHLAHCLLVSPSNQQAQRVVILGRRNNSEVWWSQGIRTTTEQGGQPEVQHGGGRDGSSVHTCIESATPFPPPSIPFPTLLLHTTTDSQGCAGHSEPQVLFLPGRHRSLPEQDPSQEGDLICLMASLLSPRQSFPF